MPDDFYARTDRAIDLLNRRAIRRFDDAQKKAAERRFDELTVVNVTKTLYEDPA